MHGPDSPAQKGPDLEAQGGCGVSAGRITCRCPRCGEHSTEEVADGKRMWNVRVAEQEAGGRKRLQEGEQTSHRWLRRVGKPDRLWRERNSVLEMELSRGRKSKYHEDERRYVWRKGIPDDGDHKNDEEKGDVRSSVNRRELCRASERAVPRGCGPECPFIPKEAGGGGLGACVLSCEAISSARGPGSLSAAWEQTWAWEFAGHCPALRPISGFC